MSSAEPEIVTISSNSTVGFPTSEGTSCTELDLAVGAGVSILGSVRVNRNLVILVSSGSLHIVDFTAQEPFQQQLHGIIQEKSTISDYKVNEGHMSILQTHSPTNVVTLGVFRMVVEDKGEFSLKKNC